MVSYKSMVFCIMSVSITEALRVLVFFPGPSKSHSLLGRAVATNLISAGHEVVFVSSFLWEEDHPNLKEICLQHVETEFRSIIRKTGFKLHKLVGKGNQGNSFTMAYYRYVIHKMYLEDSTLKQFLQDPNEKFDVAIVEWFYMDLYAGIAPLFECPLIWFGSTEAFGQMLKLVDETTNPAYSVDVFSTNIPPLSFCERAEELYNMIKKTFIHGILSYSETSLYNRVYTELASKRGVFIPSYSDAIYNGSFLFINSHPSVGLAYRLPQNAKYIGGYHIDAKVKPLPEDLQKIMDEAQNGVILFSLGSQQKSSELSENMKKSLLMIFGGLKEVVIWKFEEELENVPSNVFLTKWTPQQSILAHPNLKIFITHGGQLSMIESVHFAIPVIIIPIMADQHINMRSATSKGFGIFVELSEDLPSNLNAALSVMLTNDTYKSKAKELSLIYHDRPDPGKELVYWVEHVVKTGGAPHLRSAAIHLPFYKKMFLDLAVLVILVLSFTVAAVKRLHSCILCLKYKCNKLKRIYVRSFRLNLHISYWSFELVERSEGRLTKDIYNAKVTGGLGRSFIISYTYSNPM